MNEYLDWFRDTFFASAEAYAEWMDRPNAAPPFCGRSPQQAVAEEGVEPIDRMVSWILYSSY